MQGSIDPMIAISLGANLDSAAGPPARTLAAAMQSLIRNGVRIEAVSNFYATPAWPDPSDPSYVNAAIKIRTDRSPAALLDVLHKVEMLHGRTRGKKNAPRTLDLDLIDYDGRVEKGPPILPHPRMAARAFVLIPLADVAPDWRHPATGRSIAELIAALPRRERAAIRPMSV